MIKIYTDSSFNDKYKVAGVGVVIDLEIEKKLFKNCFKLPNNNTGELAAIWYALSIARKYKPPFIIYTDSQTAIDYINGVAEKKKDLTPEKIRNRLELKKWAYRIKKIMPIECQILHIKAHTGHHNDNAVNNAHADQEAKNAVYKYINSLLEDTRPKHPDFDR